ncbi:MAG: IgGFc-binding protein [Myxococcales bacterium]|nr:IgGFc-binding protein [Myxococcales bacterium]MCB9731080.1 IgGFc-binding protein [Deltaproteobacteria bacterium]
MKSLACLGLLLIACSSPGGSGGGFTAPTDTGGVQFGDSVGGGSDADTVTTPACTSDAQCPTATPKCTPTGICVACLLDGDCGSGRCTNGTCVSATCSPGETMCSSGNIQLTCNAAGDDWDTFACSGACADGHCQGCAANERVCNGQTVQQCRGDGSGYDPVLLCQGDQQCIDGKCLGCYPGTRRCGEASRSEVCNDDGVWTLLEDCSAAGLACLSGSCVSPCVSDIKGQSNSGCDYWAIDLDNHYAAQNGPFAIIVSNPSDRSATVTVSKKDNATDPSAEVARRDVAPGGLEIISLPQRNMGAAGIFWTAYRVESTSPIIAYQFNPLDNVDVFSNDASLLLPANTFGAEYVVVSRFELLGGGENNTTLPYRGEISVVASGAHTDVTVTPTCKTQAGANMQTMVAGQSYTYALEPYQVLNIKSDQEGGDLTGTIITATKPVAVFAGHEAAVSGEVCCADHLEQQMFPTKTWGSTYVATKSYPRQKEKDYWRVVASEPDTVVTFTPAVAPSQTLGRGGFMELATTQDFVITATKPIMVSQLLASSSEIVDPPAYRDCTLDGLCAPGYTCTPVSFGQSVCAGATCSTAAPSCQSGHVCTCFGLGDCRCTAVGDPALILMPPIEQFRDSYVFLTPNKYNDDYINIVAPTGTTVVFDNTTLGDGNFIAVPQSSWRVARLKVTDGVHRVTSSPGKVGVIVYGYDRDVSYGYPAGLNLTDL